jgi:hypothetical protein
MRSNEVKLSRAVQKILSGRLPNGLIVPCVFTRGLSSKRMVTSVCGLPAVTYEASGGLSAVNVPLCVFHKDERRYPRGYRIQVSDTVCRDSPILRSAVIALAEALALYESQRRKAVKKKGRSR